MPRKAAKKTTVSHRVKRVVKHVVVPHKANGFHPHIIRRNGLVIVLASIVVLQLMPQQSFNELTVLGDVTDVTSQRLLDDSNAERATNNIAPLKIDKRLGAAATNKAKHMFENQYWAHTSPDGTTPWYWIRDVDYKYSYAGENLAKGFQTSSTLISAWMASKEHRDNLLNPNYEDVGFAVLEGSLNGETTKLVVAMYGTSLRAGDSGVTQTVLGATGTLSPIAHIGVALQSMTPTLLATIILLLGLIIISLWAHMYRKYLPKSVQSSWKRHHGLYKAAGMASLAVPLILLYSGGQIG